jgi:hypothetical protein
MKTIVLLAASALSLSLMAQNVKKTYNQSSFTKLKASSALGVEYIQSNEFKVEVSAPAKFIDFVKVNNTNQELSVKLVCESCNMKNGEQVIVYVYAPHLSEVKMSAACSFKSKNTIKQNDFKLSINGASSATLQLDIADLNLDIEGASTAKLSGTAKKANVKVNGASGFKGEDLKTASMKINCNGVSTSKVNVSEQLVAKSSGMSNIKNVNKAKSQSIDNDNIKIDTDDSGE